MSKYKKKKNRSNQNDRLASTFNLIAAALNFGVALLLILEKLLH